MTSDISFSAHTSVKITFANTLKRYFQMWNWSNKLPSNKTSSLPKYCSLVACKFEVFLLTFLLDNSCLTALVAGLPSDYYMSFQ